MPLTILGPLVVIGILGIALILHLLGRTAPRRFANTAEARDAWAREYPENAAVTVLLSSDNRAALIRATRGLGLVWCFGDDTVARIVTKSKTHATATGLAFERREFAARHIDVVLNTDDLAQWQSQLEAA